MQTHLTSDARPLTKVPTYVTLCKAEIPDSTKLLESLGTTQNLRFDLSQNLYSKLSSRRSSISLCLNRLRIRKHPADHWPCFSKAVDLGAFPEKIALGFYAARQRLQSEYLKE